MFISFLETLVMHGVDWLHTLYLQADCEIRIRFLDEESEMTGFS